MNSSQLKADIEKYVMGTYKRLPIGIVSGKGSWIWDFKGKKYLDFTTGIAVNNLGHCNEKINNEIIKQIQKYTHASNLFFMEPQAELAKLLVENSFADKVFFCNSGTEAVEASIKLARLWGKGNGKKYKIVSTTGSFHGRTYGALSATGTKDYQDGFEPLVPGFEVVEYGNVEELEEVLNDGEICAFIVEPIQGENGVIIPPENYLFESHKLCKKHNVLYILDEIQVGIGRTGKLFAYEHLGIEPDIMALAKAIGGGLPCGAILASDEIASYFKPGSHGTTFGGNPVAVSCGYATIKTILEDNILKNTTEYGQYFLSILKNLEKEYPDLIKETRGKGLILGIEFHNQKIAKAICDSCIELGLLTILTVNTVMRILPPLSVKKDEIDLSLQILNTALKEAH